MAILCVCITAATMKTAITFAILLTFSVPSYTQNSKIAREIFMLVNSARTDPQSFLKTHGAKIRKSNASYVHFLERASPQKPITWDPGLEAMAKAVVEEGALDPVYEGSMDYCGLSWGNGAGNIKTDPLLYLVDFYTNTHGPDYEALGIYFNSTLTAFSYQWGRSCDQIRMEFPEPAKIDTSDVDFKKLNTAHTSTYMTASERRMLMEINFVRAYPKVYALLVARFLYDKTFSTFGLDEADHQAGVELIAELESMDPVSVLSPSFCVYDAARLHGLDSKQRGFFSHTGSDGSDPWDRILRRCTQYRSGNENGVGGNSADPRVHVINLLLDSGVPSRGHRRNMLDPQWRYGACFRYDDGTYKNFWVQAFAY